MDEALSELRRAHESNPADEAAARHYEQGLRRAGAYDELDGLYQLSFKCPLPWGELEGSSRDSVKHCGTCDRDVYYVKNRREMARFVVEGACVALDPETVEETLRVLVDADSTHPGQADGRPCVVEVAPGSEPRSLRGVKGKIKAPRRAPSAEPEVISQAKLLLDQVDRRRLPSV